MGIREAVEAVDVGVREELPQGHVADWVKVADARGLVVARRTEGSTDNRSACEEGIHTAGNRTVQVGQGEANYREDHVAASTNQARQMMQVA